MSTKHLHIISKHLLHVQKRSICAYSYIQVYILTIHCMCYDFENPFFFTFSRFCVVQRIQIYHRTSSIHLMYKANMFTISFNSENDHSTSFSHLLSIFLIKITDFCFHFDASCKANTQTGMKLLCMIEECGTRNEKCYRK